jgi:hypothetical protein
MMRFLGQFAHKILESGHFNVKGKGRSLHARLDRDEESLRKLAFLLRKVHLEAATV